MGKDYVYMCRPSVTKPAELEDGWPMYYIAPTRAPQALLPRDTGFWLAALPN